MDNTKKSKYSEKIKTTLFKDDYIYENSETARKEFARSFITSNDLNPKETVSELVENIESSAEQLKELASIFGDLSQQDTSTEQWEQYICLVANEYINKYISRY